jgi:hypothetical protein
MGAKFLNGEPRFKGKYNEEIISMGFYPMEDINTVKGNYYIRDVDGYIYRSSLTVLRRGNGSYMFHSKNKYTIHNLKLYIQDNKIPYQVVSEEYVIYNEKLDFYCALHGIFSKELNHFVSKEYYCPDCCSKGTYIETQAERNKDLWLKIPCEVYTIKLYNDDEVFYKIGITKQSVKKRFSKENKTYSYDIIDIIKTNLYDAVYIEKRKHMENYMHKYTPKQMMYGGHTECFSNLVFSSTEAQFIPFNK